MTDQTFFDEAQESQVRLQIDPEFKALIKPPSQEKPKAGKAPDKTPDPAPETVPLAQYNALLEEHNTLLEGAKELANEVETLTPFKDGTEVQVMRQLRAELEQVERSRDHFMNESAERQGSVNYWTRRAKKAERAVMQVANHG